MANLILYYSRKGENYFNGNIRSIPKGNTEYVAEFIQEAVGGDLFEIETIDEYPMDYDKCTRVAKTELKNKARPKLKRCIDSLDSYSDVFVCGPCWWGTFPMAVFTQLDMLDWSGKRAYAVMTHEGSGLGNSVKDLKDACKGGVVIDSLAIQGGSASGSKDKVQKWAKDAVKKS
jgi:flavodoxin